jgi:hypothetical protein
VSPFSVSIVESVVGCSVTRTRQNAGRLFCDSKPGNVSEPAVTASAAVSVASGNVMLLSNVQSAAAKAAGALSGTSAIRCCVGFFMGTVCSSFGGPAHPIYRTTEVLSFLAFAVSWGNGLPPDARIMWHYEVCDERRHSTAVRAVDRGPVCHHDRGRRIRRVACAEYAAHRQRSGWDCAPETSSVGTFRASFAAYLIEATCDITLNVLLYALLRP